MTSIRILVVIPTLNEADVVSSILDELSHDIPDRFDVLFVVADGGSTDGTQQIVQTIAKNRSDVLLVRNARRLQSAGVNLAVQLHGRNRDVLVRCDAHALYPPGFIRKLVETADRVGSQSVVVPMDTIGASGVQKAIALLSNSPLGTGGSAHRGGRRGGFVDHGHHALMRIAAFEQAGGYDETFSHNEDAELDCRLRALGGQIYLDADLRLLYRPRATLRALWTQYFNYGKGRSRTVRRHPKSLRLRQLAVPVVIGICILSLALAPFWPPLGLPAFGYLGALVTASVVFAWRAKSLAGLLTGPSAFVMHTSWAFGFVVGFLTVPTSKWRVGDIPSTAPNDAGNTHLGQRDTTPAV